MQHVIIGTAGHIDHGKTTLIKAMTGRDTDTLKEEKERGISINLGFTYFDLPSGKRAGIIDVPGHEKFIKNAIAGISGMDIVLMVIAADEGIMPQTREHLNILELLDIKKGIVVITKSDMVDDEWLQMVTEDIREEIKPTFLKDAPIIAVDSVSRKGIDELCTKIDEMTGDVEERDTLSDFRIPVDRVFTISGFGTVITGTLISGVVNLGDPCEIYTRGLATSIRNIQIHDTNVERAYPGQRVAVNLAGIKTGEVARGDVVSSVGAMKNSMMIDCRLKYLKDAPRPLKNRDRVRVYHGTSETLGRVSILDREEVKPGESALVQIRLEGTIAAIKGDKYVIRSYSPLVIIGGGTILDPNPAKHKLSDKSVADALLVKEKGSPEELIEQCIKHISAAYPKLEDIIKATGSSMENAGEIIDSLEKSGRIYSIQLPEGKMYIHYEYLNKIKEKCISILDEFHGSHPLSMGILREEFKNKVFGKEMKQKLFDKFIELLSVDTVDGTGNVLWKKGFEVQLSKRQQEIEKKLYDNFLEVEFQPPKPEDIIKTFGREEKEAKRVFDYLVEKGSLIKINDEMFLLNESLARAKDIVMNIISESGELTAAQFRDAIGASRKYAVAILEYFDGIKLTRRLEDKRVLFGNRTIS